MYFFEWAHRWSQIFTDFSSKFSITVLSFWHKADLGQAHCWLSRMSACQLNPASQANYLVSNSVRACLLSVSALHPLSENQSKENVILVKSWKFEICNLTDFLDSVKERILFILLIYGDRKPWYKEDFLKWKFVQKVRFFVFVSVNFIVSI